MIIVVVARHLSIVAEARVRAIVRRRDETPDFREFLPKSAETRPTRMASPPRFEAGFWSRNVDNFLTVSINHEKRG